jgi:hypothetical protein
VTLEKVANACARCVRSNREYTEDYRRVSLKEKVANVCARCGVRAVQNESASTTRGAVSNDHVEFGRSDSYKKVMLFVSRQIVT